MIRGSANSLYLGAVSGALNVISFAEMGLIGLSVFPAALVGSKSDYFWKIPATELLRMPNPRKALGANAQRDEYTFTQDTYGTKLYEEEAVVRAEESAEFITFDLQKQLAMMKVMELMRAHEKRVADQCIDTTTFANDSGVATGMNPAAAKWDVTATALPIDDIITGKLAIRKKCGRTPDTLVVGEFIYEKLCINKQVRESLGLRYNPEDATTARLDPKALAKALGIQRVLIANGLYNSAKKGQAASNTYIWDQDYAFLCCTSTAQIGGTGGSKLVLGEPSIGRTLAWSEFGGLLEVHQYGERVDDAIINVRQHVQEKRLLTECGFLYHDVMT